MRELDTGEETSRVCSTFLLSFNFSFRLRRCLNRVYTVSNIIVSLFFEGVGIFVGIVLETLIAAFDQKELAQYLQ